ncbi:MAG: hypothetical protein KatS3mg059_0296 [Thermomicrobiales bacterium]|nr:MAG: hypothetical protein KatS3mg059_0296 [Thermomicrobiales bacterium]
MRTACWLTGGRGPHYKPETGKTGPPHDLRSTPVDLAPLIEHGPRLDRHVHPADPAP